MKFLFDLSGRDHSHNAIFIFSLRVLSGFKANGYGQISVLCNSQNYQYVRNMFPEYPCMEVPFLGEGKGLRTNVRNLRLWRKAVRSIEHDILFIPHVFPPYFCFFKRNKTVLVLHDLQGLKIYKGIRLWACRIFYPLALWRCKIVITISDFVKHEVHRVYPFISGKKLHTVYNGVVLPRVEKAEEPPFRGKYILYVSTLMEHKNVITLLKAFRNLRDKFPHHLIIIGRSRAYWEETALPYIKQEGMEDRVCLVSEPVSDEMLAQYYMHADLFIHPSLLEGFGYTPIEAALYGTQVLTNKSTALHETTLGLLNYYDPPTDAEAMSTEMERLLTMPVSKERLQKIVKTFRERYDNRSQTRELHDLILTLLENP